MIEEFPLTRIVSLQAYSLSNISKVLKLIAETWAGRVARIGRMGKAYGISVGRFEGRRPPGEQRRR
jgi:hypothetical protein